MAQQYDSNTMRRLKKNGKAPPIQEDEPKESESVVPEPSKMETKVDAFITENSDQWKDFLSLSEDEKARRLVQNEVERKEEIKQSVWKEIENDPVKRRQIAAVVGHLPRGMQKQAMIDIGVALRSHESEALKISQEQPPRLGKMGVILN